MQSGCVIFWMNLWEWQLIIYSYRFASVKFLKHVYSSAGEEKPGESVEFKIDGTLQRKGG